MRDNGVRPLGSWAIAAAFTWRTILIWSALVNGAEKACRAEMNKDEIVRLLQKSEKNYLSAIRPIVLESTIDVDGKSRSSLVTIGKQGATVVSPWTGEEIGATHGIGFNSQYNFQISKPKNGKTWTVNRISLAGAWDEKDKKLNELTMLAAMRPLSVLNMKLSTLCSHPSVECRISEIINKERELNFESLGGIAELGFDHVRGKVVLYDGAYQLIKEGEIEYTASGQTIREMIATEYAGDGDPPFLASLATIADRANGSFPITFSNKLVSRTVNDSDFTLTRFGLPEPPGTTVLRSPVPYWLLFGFGSIGFFAMAGYLYSRRRSGSRR